jgi:predicted XRE-type DNA-binding protein
MRTKDAKERVEMDLDTRQQLTEMINEITQATLKLASVLQDLEVKQSVKNTSRINSKMILFRRITLRTNS